MPSRLVNEIIEFAHAHRVPEGHLVGKPIVLMDWQIRWLEATFDPQVATSLLSIARRGGKTMLCAIVVAAALYGPLVVTNSLLLSASRSRDQAALIFKYVVAMARLSGFSDQLTIRDAKKELVCTRTGVTYQAVSADASTQHGKSAYILITDELGQVRGERDELYETLSSGQGSYTNPKHLVISTRAPSDSDLFNILVDDALHNKDPSVSAIVYSAPDDCDLEDQEAWEAANPSLKYGVRSMEDIARQAREAKRIPSREAAFRNLILNQKVDVNSPFITPGVWKQGDRPVNERLFRENYVYGGLDLSARRDITGLVLAVEDPETGDIHVKPFCWTPEEGLAEKAKVDKVPYDLWRDQGFLKTVPGNAIHYDHVADDIANILSEYEVMEVRFDRWRIDQLTHELDKIGFWIPLEAMGQGYKDMDAAVTETESLLLDGKLVHGGHPILTNHISNVIIDSDPTNARKPNKKKAINKIDVAVAMMMAVAAVRKTMGDESGGAGLYGSDEGAQYATV